MDNVELQIKERVSKYRQKLTAILDFAASTVEDKRKDEMKTICVEGLSTAIGIQLGMSLSDDLRMDCLTARQGLGEEYMVRMQRRLNAQKKLGEGIKGIESEDEAKAN